MTDSHQVRFYLSAILKPVNKRISGVFWWPTDRRVLRHTFVWTIGWWPSFGLNAVSILHSNLWAKDGQKVRLLKWSIPLPSDCSVGVCQSRHGLSFLKKKGLSLVTHQLSPCSFPIRFYQEFINLQFWLLSSDLAMNCKKNAKTSLSRLFGTDILVILTWPKYFDLVLGL